MRDEHEAFLGLRTDAERRASLRRLRGDASDAGSDSEQESDESEDDDDEGDVDQEGQQRGGKRVRLDEDGNALVRSVADAAWLRVKTRPQPRKIPRAQLNLFRKRKDRYYNRGSWFGQSVAGQMYSLATSLNRCNNNLLW